LRTSGKSSFNYETKEGKLRHRSHEIWKGSSEALVIPFIAEIDLQRPYNPDNLDVPSFNFQQDNAPSHESHWTLEMLHNAGIDILEHPDNSPDMNAI
jgi:hypothetical protein